MRKEPSTSASTAAAYLRRATQLRKRAERDQGHPLTPREFVTWLLRMRETENWSPSTWRQYRGAVRYWLETEGLREFASRLDTPVPDPGAYKKRMRASTVKWKRVPLDRFARLSAWLAGRPTAKGTAFGLAVVDWIAAGIITGLRPCEWAGARLVEKGDGGLDLVVRNAKNSNGRAHGVTRTIHVSSGNPAAIALIRRHMARVASWMREGEAGFRAAQETARRLLAQGNRELWPRSRKRITLYSARHQFAADHKRALGPDEVAALMGHAAVDTATVHYGRAASGRSGICLARPSREDLDRVRQLNPAGSPRWRKTSMRHAVRIRGNDPRR